MFFFHFSAHAHAYTSRQTVILMLFNVYGKYARIQSKSILCAHENGQTRRKIEEKKKESKCTSVPCQRTSKRKTKREKEVRRIFNADKHIDERR